MATYKYKARDRNGQVVEGSLTSESENSAAMMLEQQGSVPISIVKMSGSRQSVDLLAQFKRIKPAEINMFTRQLYTLQKAGIPLLSGFSALLEQTTNSALKEVIKSIMTDIESGTSLSAAINKHPKTFNALYVNMVESGEVSGKLIEVLDRLSLIGMHEERINKRVKGALRYPVIVVVGLVLGFLVLIALVMPRFSKLYADLNADLPFPTKVLLGIQYGLSHYWWLLLIFSGGLVFFAHKIIQTEKGRYQWDKFKLRLPIFGPLLNQLIMSRFSRITSMLMRSGIPLMKILDLTAASVGNVIVTETIEHIKTSVNSGKTMNIPMRTSGLFPPLVVQMVTVGESTGKVDDLLLHVAEYYDEQIDFTISSLISLIEPLLVFVLGMGVLFMALGIFLPMWSLMDAFRN